MKNLRVSWIIFWKKEEGSIKMSGGLIICRKLASYEAHQKQEKEEEEEKLLLKRQQELDAFDQQNNGVNLL